MSAGAFIIQPRAIIRTLELLPGPTGRKACLLLSLLRNQALAWKGRKIWKTPQSIKKWASETGSDPRSIKKAFDALVAVGILAKSRAEEHYLYGGSVLLRVRCEEEYQFLPKDGVVYEVREWRPDPRLPKSASKIYDKFERAILPRHDLSDTAKILFEVLSSLHFAPSLSEARKSKPDHWFACVLSVTERCICKSLAQLRAIGAIKTVARTRPDHRQDTNLHIVVSSDKWKLPSTACKETGRNTHHMLFTTKMNQAVRSLDSVH